MLAKQTILDKIEIETLGILQVRFSKQVIDGATILFSEYHRTSFAPGSDIDEQMGAVNSHLGRMQWPAVALIETQRIKDHATIAWTPEIIAAFQATKAAKV